MLFRSPSDRVQAARFGACLMAEPQLVAECVERMRNKVHIPITVKTRTGIDDRDSYEHLAEFVRTVSAAGCDTFIIHARKAWLKGLSPAENREIPPLQYETVYQLKRDFPHLAIVINGGFTTLTQVLAQYAQVDGVMVGRAAYHHPYMLAAADAQIFSDHQALPSRKQVLTAFIDYARRQQALGCNLRHMARHLIGLYQGENGARAFRRLISEGVCRSAAGLEILEQTLMGTAPVSAPDTPRSALPQELSELN